MKEEQISQRRHVKSRYPVLMRFNVRRLVRDLGGPGRVAQRTGVPRGSVYRWIHTGIISSAAMELLLSRYTRLKLDDYFELLPQPVQKDTEGNVVLESYEPNCESASYPDEYFDPTYGAKL